MTIGLKDKKWADEFSLKGFYSDFEKDVQHNQVMEGIPYGEVKSFNTTKGLNVLYRNGFGQNLDIELIGGFNNTERIFFDVSPFVYNWFGERITEANGDPFVSQPGELGPASHQFTWDDNYFLRLNSTYRISDYHLLNLTIAPSYTFRSGEDLFVEGFDPLTTDRELITLVNGLEYTYESSNGKLQNTLFGKRYDQRLKTKRPLPNDAGFSITDRSVNYYGYGNGLRYEFSPQFASKLTYEYAVRMPRQDEVFGDGQFILQNLELQPERSHNANLELEYNAFGNGSNWSIKSNLFLRQVEDLILLIPSIDRTSIFQNVFEAKSLGFELSGRWIGFQQRLTLDFNTTYQNFYNNSSDGEFASFQGDRIPNTPYLFANGSVNYSFPDIIKDSDRLSFFWSSRYVHQFFLSWESAGIREFKLEIPQQLVHNMGLTYNISSGKSL